MVSDFVGIKTAVIVVAVVALLTLPLTVPLKNKFIAKG